MASLKDLIDHLDGLLEPRRFDDYGPNGLQVPGPAEVATVASGVSAHAELFERAAAEGAGLVLVHHGLFWKGQPLEVTPAMHRRLRVLFDHDMALAAYHLPLDAHPEHGNNVLLARELGLGDLAPLGDIGVQGRFDAELTLDVLAERVRAAVGREPLVISGGEHEIRSVGLVTGGGTDYVHDAVAAGLDAFLTGEPAERAFGIARDDRIHFLAAGHHATETFGVKRLGDLLAASHGIRHVHIDVPNPI